MNISIHIARHTYTCLQIFQMEIWQQKVVPWYWAAKWNFSALWCHVKNQREESEATCATCLGIHVKYRMSELNTPKPAISLRQQVHLVIWHAMKCCCFMWGYVPDNWVITTVIDGPGHVERCTAQRQSKAATSGQHPVQVVWGSGNTKVSYGFFN